MKKIIISLAVCASLVATSASAANSYFSSGRYAAATTTVVRMTAGTATTTYQLGASANGDVDENFLFIQLKASTTATILNWYYQFSNDGVDWFNEDNTLESTGAAKINHASTTVTHVWTPGNTVSSTTRKVLKVPSISSIFKRVVFTLPIGSAGGELWIMDNAKRNYSY